MMDSNGLKKKQVSNVPYPPHGGNTQALAKTAGINPDQLIDFSASINPLTLPSCVSQLLLETPRLLREYPDPHCSLITQRISQATGAPEDWIRVTNGSTEMIYLLPHLLDDDQEVVIIDPCFSEYEEAFTAFGFQPKSIALSADNNFQAHPSTLFQKLNEIPKLNAIIFGNPTSPTGKLYGKFLPYLQEYCEERNANLIIDEAFIDFSSSDNSAWNLLKKTTNLILIRSLTKFYSIPGVRIGYGILHPEKNIKINSFQYPWSVNAFAQAIGAEVIADKAFQERTRNWITGERSFMFQALNSIKEIEVFPSETNFLLFRILEKKEAVAQGLYTYLLSQSLLIRNCGNFKGLDESFFRISIRERLDNQKLLDSINGYFSTRQRDFEK
jgi:threonine-phosphate decarboxylase